MFILIKVVFLAVLFLITNETVKILIGKRIKRDIFRELQKIEHGRKKIKNKAVVVFISIFMCLLLLGYGFIYSIGISIIILFLAYGTRNIRKNT